MSQDLKRVAVTGSTGLLGGHLCDLLRSEGHRVHPVVRRRDAAVGDAIFYSPDEDAIDTDAFEGLDVVVHLGGYPIGERWTEQVRRAIRRSRVEGTSLLARALASLDRPPEVLVSASGIHYYGDSGDRVLTESSPAGTGFMPEVCVAWEAAARPAADAGIRVVHPRTGLVLGQGAPLIDKIELPFKLGVGGRVGSGRQWYPWIALEDEIRALWFLATEDSLSGGVNLCAPNPVTNAELTEALGEVLHRPTVLPIPVFALRLLYGEMGVTLGTDSLRAVPTKLLDAGFEFRHVHLRDALEAVW